MRLALYSPSAQRGFAIAGVCQALDCLDSIAQQMAGLLAWTATERDAQVAAYRRELEPMRRFSGVQSPELLGAVEG